MAKLLKNRMQIQGWLFILIICGGIFFKGTAAADDFRIFILHSYHQEYPWTHNENRGFTKTLSERLSAGEVAFSTEYLDTKRVEFGQEYQEFFFNYLKQKYAHYKPDVIFSSDDNALTFLLQFKEKLFGEVPVVFCGVNNLDVESELNRQQFTGVFEKKEILPNLALLKNINPQSGKVIFLGDDSSTHQAILQKIRVDITSQFPEQNFMVFSSTSLSQHTNQLKLHKEGVVFLTTIGGIKDEKGVVVPLQKTISSIVGVGNYAVLSMEDVYLADGVLGGYVTSGYAQGKEAAHLVFQVLNGDLPSSIPLVTESPNEFMFNYPQLERFGLSISDLPEKSIILKKPQSFYEHYTNKIWAAVFFLILQMIVIFVLVQINNKRKKAETSLQNAHEGLEQRVVERTADLDEANERLRKERDNVQRYLDIAGVMLVVLNDVGEITLINKKGCEILEVTEENIIGMNWFENFLPKEIVEEVTGVYNKLMAGDIKPVEYYTNPIVNSNGEKRLVAFHNTILKDENDNPIGVLFSGEDVTERNLAAEEKEKLELQLHQAHKMEAIGTLAGGIAHDFNNILAAILGYADLAKEESSGQGNISEYLEEVLKAGNRAKELVQQILSFSRKEDQERAPVEIQLIAKEALNLLRASIPSTIEIQQNIGPACGNIMADPTQIHQVLMNLCTNATQAMGEEGGVLKVDMNCIEFGVHDLQIHPNQKPGIYVRLTVRDNGIGLEEKYLDRIFDPYFTTKEFGQGSGMGLAVVAGIVKSHDGMITVESQLGQGTEFNVYFPSIEDQIDQDSIDTEPPPTGNEKILVVDDERSIADLTQRRVERLGYQVTAKTSSLEALELFRSQPDAYDLIITDQTMPEMSGEQMAKALLAIRPELPIILCTGYSSKMDAEKAKEIGISAYLMKPADIRELAKIIRDVLDEKTVEH